MRKLILLLSLCAFATFFSQQKIKPIVDERVEILSIAFRLAGAEEYSSVENKNYTDEISKYFKDYKNYPLIEFIKENRNKYGLGYDAVMSMAIHLNVKKGKFTLVKVKENTLDTRWKDVDLKLFITYLNGFYKQSKFQTFFDNHKNEYSKAIDLYSESILSDFNQNWYSKFYGKTPDEEYKIILGYGNGGGNYGVNVKPLNKKTIVNAIIGVWKFDEKGNPVFEKNNFQPLLIHEFNHSFVNYLLDLSENKEKLQNSANKIYKLVEKDMQNQAYGNWETMINESIVRASVIRYMMDNHYAESEIESGIKAQNNRKFLWTKDLVERLGEYESDRKTYPTLKSFYPKIIEFFNNESLKIAERLSDYEKSQPVVKSIIPDIRDKNDISINTKEITVYFDKELTGKGVSINFTNLGMEHYPIKDFLGYTENNNAIKLLLDLKPNTEYEFILSGNRFMSKDGFPLKETLIKFKTK